ncbi:matrix metallopeptidase [Orbilia ellipsospora]|uniref:Matrix metallopeptidase n=1 Tax=Orbilia ellipsospora TaxID=2528407 RepID=A0AAV9X0C3_9PEZI
MCSSDAHDAHESQNDLEKRQTRYGGNPVWPRGTTFKWRLEGTIQGLDQTSMESAMERAFRKWESLTGFKFMKVSQSPNVRISVKGPNQVDREFQRTTLAVGGGTWIGTTRMNGSIKFNDTRNKSVRWNVPTFHNVCLHEFGHVLGLDHVPVRTAVMAATLIEYSRDQVLTNPDINAYRRYYGIQNPGPQRQLIAQGETPRDKDEDEKHGQRQWIDSIANINSTNTTIIKRSGPRDWRR